MSSLFVVRQMKGIEWVSNENGKHFYDTAKQYASSFKACNFGHISRTGNPAEALAIKAIERRETEASHEL